MKIIKDVSSYTEQYLTRWNNRLWTSSELGGGGAPLIDKKDKYGFTVAAVSEYNLADHAYSKVASSIVTVPEERFSATRS